MLTFYASLNSTLTDNKVSGIKTTGVYLSKRKQQREVIKLYKH